MPRVCTVCTHEQRAEIDRALVTRSLSFRDIAGQYAVSKTAVGRHLKEHLPETLARGREAEQLSEADKLLVDIKQLQARTLMMLRDAENAGELRTALAAVREARNNFALLAEMRGQLDRRPQINILLSSPAWLELKALIVGALERHPAARDDVVEAIEGATTNGLRS